MKLVYIILVLIFAAMFGGIIYLQDSQWEAHELIADEYLQLHFDSLKITVRTTTTVVIVNTAESENLFVLQAGTTTVLLPYHDVKFGSNMNTTIYIKV